MMKLKLLLIASIGTLIWCGTVHAQTSETERYTLVLRGVPIREALDKLVRTTQMDLVYPSGLVVDRQVFCNGKSATPEELLQCILAGSGIDYVRSSSGAYILIKAVREPPAYGDLGGSVIDQATGEPLPYATVLLADASTGTTTNEAGFFSFASLISGQHRIVVTYVGYETATDSVWVHTGESQRLQIAMLPRAVVMRPVVIDGLQQRLPSADLGTGIITADRLYALSAAGTPDVARGAGSIPGVSAQQPLADLHIQGGASGEHLTLLDGVPVRDPVSLGRHLGAFSPLAVERLMVHKAGFGAEHGSHLSGVISVEQDVAGTGQRNLTFSADPVSLNGKAQGRFNLTRSTNGAGMIAVRSSYWNVYKDPGIESLLRNWNAADPLLAAIWIREDVSTASLGLTRQQPSVGFSDIHGAARIHLSPFRTLHGSFYRARNQIGSDLLAVNENPASDLDRLMLTRDDYDWTNWAGQITHSWLLSARAIALLRLQGSSHASHYSYHAAQSPIEKVLSDDEVIGYSIRMQPRLDSLRSSDEQNDIEELSARAEIGYSVASGHYLESALEATLVSSGFRLGNQFISPFKHETQNLQIAGFVRDQITLGPGITVEPSLRLTYLPTRQTVYAEPRLSLRYDNAGRITEGYALRLAGGIYRQFVNQFALTSSGSTSVVPSVLFWLPVTGALAPPRAYHLAGDALFMPARDWTVSIEGYYKWQPRLLALDYVSLMAQHPATRPRPPAESLDQSAFIGAVRGRAFGGSTRLQVETERYSGSATYSFSRSLRQVPHRFNGNLEASPWEEPHRLSVDARISLLPYIFANVNWNGVWGRAWGFRHAYYDYFAALNTRSNLEAYDLNHPSAQHLPPSYRLDAGIAFEHTWLGTTVALQAFVVNLLDRANVYDWSLQPVDGLPDKVARTLPGRHASISFQVRF